MKKKEEEEKKNVLPYKTIYSATLNIFFGKQNLKNSKQTAKQTSEFG